MDTSGTEVMKDVCRLNSSSGGSRPGRKVSGTHFSSSFFKLLSPTLPILMNSILLSPHPCPPTLTSSKIWNVH